MAKPRQNERAEQAGIVKLLRSIGSTVYVSGITRRSGDFMGTMQSRGIPDLEAFLPVRARIEPRLPPLRELLKVEVKAAGGRLRSAQAEYRDLCRQANVHHVVGGLDTVIGWLIDHRYLRASQVPHYRAPVAAAAAQVGDQ